MDTYSKIVAYLRISPFTFEQLRKISEIHRTTLNKRLKELSEQKIILKHKYLGKTDSDQIKEKIYGILPRNPYSIFPPMIKRNYYMLNYQEFLTLKYKEIDRMLGKISDSTINNNYNTKNELKHIDNHIKNYYSKNRVNKKETVDTSKHQLDNTNNEINELILKIIELRENRKRNYFKEIDHMERKVRLTDYYLRLIKLIRELELTRVKAKVDSDLLLPMTKSSKEIEKLENCIEYFSKQKMSNADILIRLSTESTLLFTKSFSIFLQMIDYEDLFYYFLERGRELLER